MYPRLLLTAKVFLFVWFLGFASLFVVSTQRGYKTAWGGKVTEGHFFLGGKGRYQEVPEETYRLAQVHEWSTAAFLAIAMGLFLLVRFRGGEKALE